ncbi:MAG: hypothetical protein PVH61_07400 [Candidatus Aminicenantes bacterium]|jgi:hypothetical protein
MKKYALAFVMVFVCLSISLSPASYRGENIDRKHFPATITKKDTKKPYKVDVVFVGKAANIRFPANQLLPPEANDNYFMTLYLKDDVIRNPEKVLLKQVKPPEVMNDSKPEDWEAAAFWYMKLDLSSLK